MSESLRERIVYRDREYGDPAVANFGAGRIFAELDGAGVVKYEYEFRGQPVRTIRELIDDPLGIPDRG